MEVDDHPALPDHLPKVYSEISPERLSSFLRRQEISASQVKLAVEAIQEHGASYIPQMNSIVVDDFRLETLTEESARFIHQLCRGELRGSSERTSSDAFFLTIIEHAFGYFFSKLLDSSRDGIERLGERVLEYFPSNRKTAETLSCLIDPARKPSSRHFDHLRTTLARTPARSKMPHLMAQVLGYALGRRLYKAFLESRISRKELQALFRDPLETRDGPLDCYVDLSTRFC
jgi:hypothetical protein